MSDNDKNTCPVCFTRMRMVKKVLTCPECGYKYCDHSRDLQDLFNTSHTHEPNYNTYTNQTTSTQQSYKPTPAPVQQPTYRPSTGSTGSTASSNTGNARNVRKIVKIIVIIYLIIMFCPMICGVLSTLLAAGSDLFSANDQDYATPKVEISSDMIETVPSVDVDAIIDNLDLDNLNIELPEIPEIPQYETEQFGSVLVKFMFDTEYPEYVSKGKYGTINRLEIEKDETGCYYACYDYGTGNAYVYSGCTELDPKDLTAFYNLESLTVYDTVIEPGDLEGLDNLTHFACTATPGEAAELVDSTKLTSLALRLPEGTTDMSGMEDFISLTSLEIDATNALVEDYSFLNNMPALTKLSLSGPGITDLSFLSNMPVLMDLTLINTGVTDLVPLTAVSETLWHLTLNNNLSVDDYTIVSKLTELTILNLNNSNLDHIDFTSTLTDLNMVEIEGNNVTSLVPLKNSQYLYYINAKNNPLEDLAGFEDICAY